MKTLFVRTLFSFIVTLLIFLVILSAFVFLGFGRSLDSWSTNKLDEVHAEIRRLLDAPDTASNAKITDNISVFVYGPDQNLIFSNRGEGRRRSFSDEDDVQKVMIDGKVGGYYHIGKVAFQNDAANQQFISSISRVLWLGALISCLIAVVYAFFFSRSLARPASIVAGGIRKIAAGNLDEDIPETGAEEISQIAKAANGLKRQLTGEQKLRVQWAQDIAHDLRTPISALKAQFEGMRDGVLSIDPKRIEQNLTEIHRVEALIKDLQELMQLENPELLPEKINVDLDALLGNIATSFSFEAEKKNIDLQIGSSGITLRGDEDLLYRALSNIMANAIRHANSNGVIELSSALDTTAGEENVIIRVKNSGEVVSPEELEHVFDRLYRGDRARNTPGSGLGLTISRQIAELHGGRISMCSDEDIGTIVKITLPR
jgi:two-component system, OmpR family, sensor histidine kinase BaeS